MNIRELGHKSNAIRRELTAVSKKIASLKHEVDFSIPLDSVKKLSEAERCLDDALLALFAIG